MNARNWKHDILTVPNALSLIRMILIPVYIRVYLRADAPRDFWLSGAILAVSCLTDALDGWIARRFHSVSLLGKVLDPLADKATQLALILCLCQRYAVLKPVLALMAVKEAYQLTACVVSFSRGKMLPGALPAGKICTAVLFASLIVLVIFPRLEPSAVTAVALTDCFFLTVSFTDYVLAYHGRHPRTRDVES